jgi:hypothetical protein
MTKPRAFCVGTALIALACDPTPVAGFPEAPVETERAALWAGTNYVTTTASATSFTLAAAGVAAPIVYDTTDWPGVARVVGHLRADIARVTGGSEPAVAMDTIPAGARQVVIVGTLGRSALVDGLVTAGKLDVTDVTGKWDTYVLQVVDAPATGVDRALVIAGSNKRGTIYGMYDLAQHIGVSPWYWWADVPAPRQPDLYVTAGRYSPGEPKVKYRGIFINDEAPALTDWANATQMGFERQFYEKVFELILRLRGNYLWPAMWGKAFAADDDENPRLADEYGVVIATSHHEPMMRAHAEWANAGYTSDQWNYGANAATVRTFWQGGITRMGNYESVVTIGMRGDGDAPLANASVSLLQQIVSDQRNIISTVTGKPAASVPQAWALYKEVQDFYDQGMQVPDDVTLLFADDNWGNVRRLPNVGGAPRAGGYGVYYHFDYVGGPHSYMWINTNPIGRIWEQMHLSYEKGVRTIFLVNVGDIKPMEYPIEFFLDYAWNPEAWPAERLPEYARLWAERQFGSTHAATIADLLTKYTKYNGRRKPEILSPTTYSLVNYREADQVIADWNALAATAQTVNDALPMNARDAFFQLVLFPVKACANLNELYVTVGKNALYRRQNRAATNDMATRAQQLYATHATLTNQYHSLASGKWNHMMKQTLIGQHPTDAWRNPDVNTMPSVQTLTVPSAASLGVSIEGTENVWPGAAGTATLPEITPFDPPGSNQYIDVFNKGAAAFSFTATAQNAPWLTLTPASGPITKETRVLVSVDWAQAPTGAAVMDVPITITGPNDTSAVVNARIRNPASPRPEALTGFAQTDGYVSIEAEHATRVVASAPVSWTRIPDFGRTLSGMTLTPTTAVAQTPGSGPRLEYDIHFFTSGSVTVQAYVAPTLPYHRSGLRYAVSFDDATPQMVDINSDTSTAAWERNVQNNVNTSLTTHTLSAAGAHTLKFWAVDTGVVLQKLVVSAGGVRTTYLGPPASAARKDGMVVMGTGAAGGTGTGGSGAGGSGAGGSGAGGSGVSGAGTTGNAGTIGAGAAGSTGAGEKSGTSGTAGTSGGVGTSGSGAAGASGGSSAIGTGGTTSGADGAPAGASGTTERTEAGCGCRVPRGGGSSFPVMALTLGLVLFRRRRAA